jgi:hypothetical protein
MTRITAYAFSNKATISLSGINMQISPKKDTGTLLLYRQFENRERELLTKIDTTMGPGKIQKFEIKKKIRNIYSIIETIRPEVSSTRDAHTATGLEDVDKNQLLRLWQEKFSSKEYIADSYQGYILMDKQRKIWIYDIVPAVKEFSQVDEENLLPLPGMSVSYSVVSESTNEELYSQDFIIPVLLEGELGLIDIFQQDIYLYHIALYYRGKCKWGVFAAKASKRRGQITKSPDIGNKSFLCNIKPDLNDIPNLKPDTYQFKLNDIPPALSKIELMDSFLRVSRIKTNTGNTEMFNSLSFQTKYFKSSNFPRTFSLIFPYK